MTAVERVTHRFTVEDYDRMILAGIFAEDDRVELIDGEIVEMAPIGPPHCAVVDRINHHLSAALGRRAIVRVQNPAVVGEWSEPQPDLAVVAWRDDFYAGAHPRPADVLVIVEVADRSLAFDRRVKFPLYAAHGIAEAWLVEVVAGTVEVHRAPGADGYGDVARVGRGGRVPTVALQGVELAVVDVVAGAGAVAPGPARRLRSRRGTPGWWRPAG